MQRNRIERIKIPILSSTNGKIVSHESQEIVKHNINIVTKAKAYEKRHNDFITCGGTKILNTFSNNVASQIAEFKQNRQIQFC